MKRIIIHIGPPKTGTSAIQKWCVKNNDILRGNGIYYPLHGLDSNGISSGNLQLITNRKRDKDKRITFSIDILKVEKLLREFYDSKFKILLISSEFLIQHMKKLKELIPNVEFICYLRNPIEIIESNYNQGIKRSRFTHPIKIESFKTLPHFVFITDYIRDFGRASLEVRLYVSDKTGPFDVIQDFLNFLNLESVKSEKADVRVNPSYVFEALEFKRWINKFELGDYWFNRIDRVLQSMNIGTYDFTFVPNSEHSTIKDFYVKRISNIENAYDIGDLSPLINAIKSYQFSAFYEQRLSEAEFVYVLDFLIKEIGLNCYPLLVKIHKAINFEDRYSRWFEEYYTKHSRYKYYYYINRIFKKLIPLRSH